MAYQTLPNGSILKFASRPSGLFNIFVGLLYLFVFIDYVSSQPTLAPLTGAATWQNVETALRVRFLPSAVILCDVSNMQILILVMAIIF